MTIKRYRVTLEGLLQGIGFRPFIFRLAQKHNLTGWVANIQNGVVIEIQGEPLQLQQFFLELDESKPQKAIINTQHHIVIALQKESVFIIKQSFITAKLTTPLIPHDVVPCDACLQEINNPHDRRYQYPFTHCCECGPRYSIVEKLPYDRHHTAMKAFSMCAECSYEYQNPENRRFHAETIACHQCGPQLTLYNHKGELVIHQKAIEQTAQLIRQGFIIAIKAVGGFQLVADASNKQVVSKLRQRKHRPDKAFALMYPSLEGIEQHCHVSAQEKLLLTSSQGPIVLLTKKSQGSINHELTSNVAPLNPDLGVMLPSSPLHYLLMQLIESPIIATSGNVSGEPLYTNNEEAFSQLNNIADAFLVHNRTICRAVDDSVVRIINQAPMVLRLARGYAPYTQSLTQPATVNHATDDGSYKVLAVGGHMKNSIAVGNQQQLLLSQHLGDLDSKKSQQSFEQTIIDLSDLYTAETLNIIHDQHPDYASTRWATANDKPLVAVQHHIAHFFSCMAEHNYHGPALGVCWDGSGYSESGLIRGGEFLFWDGEQQIIHIASLRPFPLPGGEQAIREPHRQAAGLLYEIFGDDAFNKAPSLWDEFSQSEQHNLTRMLSANINTPKCTSVGRLFDVVAALMNITSNSSNRQTGNAHNSDRFKCSFEGQAAMALEFAARDSNKVENLPFNIHRQKDSDQKPLWLIDWQPMITALLEGIDNKQPGADLAAVFHNTLAEVILSVANKKPECPLFLSGGVFQNKRLTERTTALLKENDRRVYHHQHVPSNDGGIALGQLYYHHCMGSAIACA